MSKRTIQRQNDERNRKQRTRHLFVTKVASTVILLLTLVYLLGPFKAAQTSNQRATSETIRLLTADALAHLNHLQLEALDIATRNFICGKGIVDATMAKPHCTSALMLWRNAHALKHSATITVSRITHKNIKIRLLITRC